MSNNLKKDIDSPNDSLKGQFKKLSLKENNNNNSSTSNNSNSNSNSNNNNNNSSNSNNENIEIDNINNNINTNNNCNNTNKHNCSTRNVSPPVFSLIHQSVVNPTQVFIVCSKWTSFLNGRTVKNFLMYKKDLNKSYSKNMTSDLIALNINTTLEDSLYLLSENGVASSPVMEENDEISSSSSDEDEYDDSEGSDCDSSSTSSSGNKSTTSKSLLNPDDLSPLDCDTPLNLCVLRNKGNSNSNGSGSNNNNNNNINNKNNAAPIKKRSSIYRHHLKGSKKMSSPYHHSYNHNNLNTHNSSGSNGTINHSNSNGNINGNGNSSNGNSNGNSSNGKSPNNNNNNNIIDNELQEKAQQAQQKFQQEQQFQPIKKKYTYRGIVGVLDILSFMSYLLHRRNILGVNPDHSNILKQSLKQVVSFSTLNDMRYVKDDMSLLQALEVLVSKSPPFKIHRVPVFNFDNDLVGILSQTDFLYLARENLHQLAPNYATKSIKELKLMFPVISLPTTTISKDAFQLLRSNRINGVAITDSKTASLIHCLSSDDLKNITSLKFDLLFKTILEYLESSGGIKKPIVITPDTSFFDVIKKMCDYKVQRLFTVDENFRPLTVTTISDVLLVLLNC